MTNQLNRLQQYISKASFAHSADKNAAMELAASLGSAPPGRAEELIAQLDAEIAERDARIAELEAQAGEGTSSNKYRAELYDEVWQAARDMGYGNVTGALQELAALKAKPSAGVADERAAFEAWYSEHYYEGDESCTRQWLFREPCGNYRHEHASRDWRTWQARARLNPCRAQAVQRCQCCGYLVTESEHKGCLRAASVAVPDGYALVPVEPTEIMQDAGCAVMPTVNCHPYDAGMVYKAMLAANPCAKKESGDE